MSLALKVSKPNQTIFQIQVNLVGVYVKSYSSPYKINPTGYLLLKLCINFKLFLYKMEYTVIANYLICVFQIRDKSTERNESTKC